MVAGAFALNNLKQFDVGLKFRTAPRSENYDLKAASIWELVLKSDRLLSECYQYLELLQVLDFFDNQFHPTAKSTAAVGFIKTLIYTVVF